MPCKLDISSSGTLTENSFFPFLTKENASSNSVPVPEIYNISINNILLINKWRI